MPNISSFEIIYRGALKAPIFPKGKIKPNSLKYIKPSNEADVFVHKTEEQFSTAPKKVEKMDLYNIRAYFLQKKMDLKISPDEFKTLFSYDGEEYKVKAFELLTKKMNVSKELMPNFIYGDIKNVPMCYDYASNYIAVNPNFKGSKQEFLALLRHELQHYEQNLAMFRHETLSDEYINKFANMSAKMNCQNIKNLVKNGNLEELKKVESAEYYAEIAQLRNLSETNPKEFDQYMEELFSIQLKAQLDAYNNFRQIAIAQKGLLTKDSFEGKRAAKMMKETLDEKSYWKENGEVNVAKYSMDCREIEAISAQDSMLCNIASASGKKVCVMKSLREASKAASENLSKNQKADLDKAGQEHGDAFSYKDFLSYIFD